MTILYLRFFSLVKTLSDWVTSLNLARPYLGGPGQSWNGYDSKEMFISVCHDPMKYWW